MIKSGVKGDKVTFNTLVNGCVYAKQMDSAYKITLDSFALNVRMADEVYSNLIRNLVSAKKTQWAGEITEKMKKKGYETGQYVKIESNRENSYPINYKKNYSKKQPMTERHYNVC